MMEPADTWGFLLCGGDNKGKEAMGGHATWPSAAMQDLCFGPNDAPWRGVRQQSEPQVGWGVLCCAGIAAKTCQGIKDSGHEVVAVGSRTRAKAEDFVARCVPEATVYESYADVLDDERVQVVYIPVPTALKKEWVLKAAARRKHVLVETPLAADLASAEAMVSECLNAGVQLMENTMMMHHERLHFAREVISDVATFGEVKHVVSCFSIPNGNNPAWEEKNIRMSSALEPLGVLGALGWYNVRISLWAFDYEEPEEVSCHYLETTPAGAPVTIHGMMRFPGGRFAAFDASFKCALRQKVEVTGEKKAACWDDMVVPQVKHRATFQISDGLVGRDCVEVPRESTTMISRGWVQHATLASTMSDIVSSGSLDTTWPKIALQTQKVMCKLQESGTQSGAWVRLRPRPA